MKNIIQAKVDGRVVEIQEIKKDKKVLSMKDALAESLKEAVNF